MTCKLRQIGFHLNHKTVLKLMNELGIHSILHKKRHGKRGKTSHIVPNLLNCDFTATALNQKWVTKMGNGCHGISCWTRKALFFTVDGLG